ncbi:MAG: hypothetical protein ABIT10_02945 [Alteraurantiacibacter sp.]
MKTHHTLTRSASTAIAAVLALASTTALAQVIDPVTMQAPATPATVPSAAPAIPAPVLQSPVQSTTTTTSPSATPTVSRPVVQTVAPSVPTTANAPTATASTANTSTASGTPRVAASAAPVTTARAAPAAAPRSTPASSGAASGPALATAPNATAPLSGPAESVTAAEPAPYVAPPADSQAPADNYAAPAAEGSGPDAGESAMWLGGLLSILALAGLGGVAATALRRRRKVEAVRLERPKLDPVTAKPLTSMVTSSIPAPAFADFIAAPLVTTPAVAVATEPQVITSPVSPFRHAPATDNKGLSHSGAAVSLPRERLATAEERRALINRMTDAEPDRANPFHSRKARLHRAKLIEQSIGRSFTGGKSRIDLSQYPMNWPELAQGRSAAA